MKFLIKVLALSLILLLVPACVGEHNSAPNTGLNLKSKRIYGIGQKPLQLDKTYPEDTSGQVADRIAKIRAQLYAN